MPWLITKALFDISFMIDGHELKVKAMFYRKVFDIRQIKMISSFRDGLSASTASLNCLALKIERQTLQIFHCREQLFIEQIREINPNVVVKT